MPSWPGVGTRIRKRLIEVGYEKRGRADISRFCLERRLLPSNVYRWMNGEALPDRKNILRLAAILKVHPAWLMFGELPETKNRGEAANNG